MNRGIPRQNGGAGQETFENPLGVTMPKATTVKTITFLTGYKVRLRFQDGARRTVDLEPYLQGARFRAVRKRSTFRKAIVSETGGVCWPNGADICPEVLYGTGATAAS